MPHWVFKIQERKELSFLHFFLLLEHSFLEQATFLWCFLLARHRVCCLAFCLMKIWNIMLAGSVCSLAKSSWKYRIWSYFCSLISIRVYWLFITMIVHELVFWFNSCLYHKVTLLLLLFCIVQECSQRIHTGKASWKSGIFVSFEIIPPKKITPNN